jgi:parallel beta-helix repeat protein
LLRGTVSGIMLMLLVLSTLTLAFDVLSVEASGTIYIRADGGIDPMTAPIQHDGNVYTFTDNIYEPIVVERSNIVIDGDGYTLQGSGFGYGLRLDGVVNVLENITIKYANIKNFTDGIRIIGSDHNTIVGNNITANHEAGISLGGSYNTVSENNIANNSRGVYIFGDQNIVSTNNITSNEFGIFLLRSYNIFFENNITSNSIYGISIPEGSNSRFFHNNLNNSQQVDPWTMGWNYWDDGYPSGGNYWSDYTGIDLCSGPYQNETGSDGIGDTPYYLYPPYESHKDQYPLMTPHTVIHDVAVASVVPSKSIVGQGYNMNINITVENQGDHTEAFKVAVYTNTTSIARTEVTLANGTSTTLTFPWNTTSFAKGNYTVSAAAELVFGDSDQGDNIFTADTIYIGIPGDIMSQFGLVDMKDIGVVVKAFGSVAGHPKWNPNADIRDDGRVDMRDVGIAVRHFGEVCP